MDETLLEKAKRLNIQPQEISSSPTLLEKAKMAGIQPLQKEPYLTQEEGEVVPRARVTGKETTKQLFGKYLTNIPLSGISAVLQPVKDLVKSAKATREIFQVAPTKKDAVKSILEGFKETLKGVGVGTGEALYDYLERKALEETVEGKMKTPGAVGWEITKDIVGSISKSVIEEPFWWIVPGEETKVIAKPVTEGVLPVVGETLTKAGTILEESGMAKGVIQQRKFLEELVRPIQTTAVKEAQVARTSEIGKGLFKRSIIKPTYFEEQSIKELTKIPELKSGNTFQQNWKIIENVVKKEAIDLEKNVGNNDFIVPRKELISRLNASKEVLAKSPVIVGDAEKTANKLLAGAIEKVNLNKGTGEGILKAKKEYDIWVLEQKPKAFDTKMENAFTIANREVRNVFKDFLEEKAPNIGIKKSLRRQTSLYNALDVVKPKAALELDTALGRTMERISKVVGTKNKAVQFIAAAVGIGGLGAAATFAPGAAILGGLGFFAWQGSKLVLKPSVREGLGKLLKLVGKSLNPEDKTFIEDILKIHSEINPQAGFVSLPIYKGEKDLTTKFLEYAKGKTTLSRQEIVDFARRPELKKGEADLLNNLVKGLPEGKLPAQEFADSIRRDLLKLKPVKVKEPQYQSITVEGGRFEEGLMKGKAVRGNNYEEVVFESPITTNGSSHYQNSKNYFAHARGDEVIEGGKKIWREQEIQSDLLQKEGMDRLVNQPIDDIVGKYNDFLEKKYKFSGYPSEWTEFRDSKITQKEAQTLSLMSDARFGQEARDALLKSNPKAADAILGRQQEIGQLQPFTNDRFGERIMRERIKEKAQKGYEKYRLPTGETIGKIEGFERNTWHAWDFKSGKWDRMNPEKLEVGLEIRRPLGEQWIITDILGDGRFKAVPKREYDYAQKWKTKSISSFEVAQGQTPEKYIENNSETFDLTGKSNPQYRRYENWGKFLKNKFGGKEVVDPQGNSWIEIDLKPEYKKMPIEAFGIGTLLLSEEE